MQIAKGLQVAREAAIAFFAQADGIAAAEAVAVEVAAVEAVDDAAFVNVIGIANQ
jgi:hypothetical protein